jgi:hypothetical protein
MPSFLLVVMASQEHFARVSLKSQSSQCLSLEELGLQVQATAPGHTFLLFKLLSSPTSLLLPLV